MSLRTRVKRIAAVTSLAGLVSLGIVSGSGQALAQTQPAAPMTSVTTTQVAHKPKPHDTDPDPTDPAPAPVFVFYGPYNTNEECLEAQATVVEQGGIVAWTCGFISMDPWQFGFYASVPPAIQ